MRLLWLTRMVPYPPSYGGDYVYSSHLIESAAASGARVTVLCADHGGPPPGGPAGVDWRVVSARRENPAWRSVFSALPVAAVRPATPDMRAAFEDLLTQDRWDAVVFDHLRAGWLLQPLLLRLRGARRPAIVYLSHNDEEQVSREVARAYRGNPLVRIGLALESLKVGRLERRMIAAADLVGTNTEADAMAYRGRAAHMRWLLLPPAYDGPRVPRRDIGRLPRRAVILGSYGWIAKQMNLRAFLEIAAPRFRACHAELEVVGMMPPRFEAEIRACFSSVRFSGAVPDVGERIARARVGLIAEEVGGGFKHKALHYVFHRIAVVALIGTARGSPLVAGQSMLEFPDMESLVEGALALIDDPEQVARLSDAAFDACDGRFEWPERGRALVEAIGAVCRERARAAGQVPGSDRMV